MLYDPGLTNVRNALQAVIAAEKADGHTRITLVEMARQSKADGIGNGWHPSVKTHHKMAAVMTAAIKQELGW
jgi:hypothetical protein